jgi:hypothetical protein
VTGTPLVSVIIATYNWSSVLRYAVQSVLWQECQDFELLVIGDTCTDDSAQVVASFADARIRWHNLAENSGSQSLPNNTGIAMARGRYIAYLGHDDLWLPGHLAALVAAIEEADADIAYALAAMISPPEVGFRLVTGLSASGSYEPTVLIPPSSLLHKRDLTAAIGEWRDYRTIVDPPDQDFVYRAWEAKRRFVAVPRLTVCKFPSVWRRNSYRLRLSDQQAEYARRIATEPDFLARELLEIVASYALERRLPVLSDEAMTEERPGARIRQRRIVRGLEPDDPSALPPEEGKSDAEARQGVTALSLRPERYMGALEHAIREKDAVLDSARRYATALEAQAAANAQALHDAEHYARKLAREQQAQAREHTERAEYARGLERALRDKEQDAATRERYVRAVEEECAAKEQALRDAEQYVAELQHHAARLEERCRAAEQYARALTDALAQSQEQLRDVAAYARLLEGTVREKDGALDDAQRYATSAVRQSEEQLRDVAEYMRTLEEAIGEKNSALGAAARYAASLEDAINARDVSEAPERIS